MAKKDLEKIPAALTKARDANAMRVSGKTWDEIAETLGYANGQSARVRVTQELQKAYNTLEDSLRREMMYMELERLDALQAAVWPMAMKGDTKSVDSALRVISIRSKILGFEQKDEKVTNQTLVITQDRFVEQLQDLVNRSTDE